MFLQVFADGTVIDSEGVHHLRAGRSPADRRHGSIRRLYRVRGHCGAPSTDFIEYVHVVIYERRLGRLNAHSFSYSGNTQGCDQSIRHLHTVLENLQAKLSRQPGTNPSSSAGAPRTDRSIPDVGSDVESHSAGPGTGVWPARMGNQPPGRESRHAVR